MISKEIFEEGRKKALEFFKKANVIITEEEKGHIEVADFGLGDLWHTGLETGY